jgi:tRNA pseudouridine32 synthase/23S rRNA pseudouridine746 synthase
LAVFAILYRDDDLLVIDKPAGLAVHPGPRTPVSLEQGLPALRFGLRHDPVPLHRLDRDTSGCLALGRHPAATKQFATLFAERRVAKLYWAQLDVLPSEPEGVIDTPLAKISSRSAGWRMVARADGQSALTRWHVLDRTHRLVAFRPETGRTHQIRVHASLIGCPISGDPVYGDGRGSLRLHARALTFNPPGKPELAVTAPPPPWWPVGAAV